MRKLSSRWVVLLWCVLGSSGIGSTQAAELVVKIENSNQVRMVGAIRRFDEDGNLRRPVDPRAKIDAPQVDHTAMRGSNGRWKFSDLPAGRYDLVILTGDHVRIEGFHYPPVDEFDPIMLPTAEAPAETAKWIVGDIAKSRHYENKVTPLFLAGDGKQIRILVQLLRDKPTSYDRQYGQPVATLRHEVWQYKNRYGGWVKDRRTKVLDRVLLGKRELTQWAWLWEPTLGGIEVTGARVEVTFSIPAKLEAGRSRGLLRGLTPAGHGFPSRDSNRHRTLSKTSRQEK